jgi:hypothetical protein
MMDYSYDNMCLYPHHRKKSIFFTSLYLLLIIGTSCDRGAKITLCDGGKSQYTIRIAKDADSLIQSAALTLQQFIIQISGAIIPVVADSAAMSQEVILLGTSEWVSAQVAGYRAESIRNDGFRIFTSGKNLAITGNTSRSIVNGVFGFLEETLGCRMYSTDCIIIPKQDKVYIGLINDLQEPVFSFREIHSLLPLTSKPYRDWHKLNSKEDPEAGWGSLWVHTFNRLVPPDRYFDKHPGYFSLLGGHRIQGGQLCLSNPEVVRVLTANLGKAMEQDSTAIYWSVSQNDNYLACQCDGCRALDEKYGGPSGTMIWFVNQVAEKYPDKIISTLAYQYTRQAPINIKPAPNVNIMLCTIECDRSRPIASDTTRESFTRDLEDWSALTNNILIWDYTVQFRNLVSPFPNFPVLQPNLQLFARNHATMMFQQGCGQNVGEFHEMRTYLIAKLLWSPGTDVSSVIRDFTDGYYGKAGSYIRKYIRIMERVLKRSGKRLDIYGYPYDAVKGYLRPGLLTRYTRLFDRAERAVANHPDQLQRVKCARLPLTYAILEISARTIGKKYSFFELSNGQWSVKPWMRDMLVRFGEEARQAGITRLYELGKPPEEYVQSMLHYLDQSMKRHLAFQKPVVLMTEYSEKYPVGGGKALTDGLIGVTDFHFNWLGFEGNDMVAVIDLEKIQPIHSVSMNFLQEGNSWIFLPEKVMVSFSTDGKNYTEPGTLLNTIPDTTPDIFIQPFRFEKPESKTRYLKVEAVSKKVCPPWHIGAGSPCWIFCDEISVW